MNRLLHHAILPASLTVLIGAAIVATGGDSGSDGSQSDPPMTHAERVMAAYSLGLTPDAAAAIGVCDTEVDTLFGRIEAERNEIDTISTLRVQRREKLDEVKALRSSLANPTDDVDYASLSSLIDQRQTEAAALAAQIKSEETVVRGRLLQGLATPVVCERVCSASDLAAKLPVEYQATTYVNAGEIRELLGALSALRKAEALGQPPPLDALSHASTYQARPEVAAAQASHAACITGVTARFNAGS